MPNPCGGSKEPWPGCKDQKTFLICTEKEKIGTGNPGRRDEFLFIPREIKYLHSCAGLNVSPNSLVEPLNTNVIVSGDWVFKEVININEVIWVAP